MNNGKICISICAETADEFSHNILIAKSMADLIELRFDCLTEGEMEQVKYDYDENYIFTFRPKEQGGNRQLSLAERERFWNSGVDFCGGDFEEDVVENHLDWLYKPVICSYHDFNKVPKELFEIYERMKFSKAKVDVIKIAALVGDITDAIPLWKLIEKATFENQQIIPIAMGETGKWTRILGLAHGAFMTYAALDSGKETAPGQISAQDLIEVYRVKELDKNTDVYGIIAGNTSYSLSPYIHNAAFKFHGLNSVFVPLQVQNLEEFMRRMVLEKTREIDLNFKGFAVTNPHKQEIIKYLDQIDETAETIGAVNTVKIENGKLFGYNTDAQGFIGPLINSFGDLTGANVAIFGSGGAARACVYALKKVKSEVSIMARNFFKAKQLAEEFGVSVVEDASRKSQIENADIVVNATPLGTKGEFEEETPVESFEFKNIRLAYDLVYNPFETRFLREAKDANVPTIGGFEMLIGQAIEQSKIWTGKEPPIEQMRNEAVKKLSG